MLDEVREYQREVHLIESDMERRRQKVLQEKVASQHLPMSITEEINQVKQKLATNEINVKLAQSSTIKTKEAIQLKLGGEFDYTGFQDDLLDFKASREHLERQFRIDALKVPEIPVKLGRVDFDYSIPGGSASELMLSDFMKPQVEVSKDKPPHLTQIKTNPKYLIDGIEAEEMEASKMAPATSAPVRSIGSFEP